MSCEPSADAISLPRGNGIQHLVDSAAKSCMLADMAILPPVSALNRGPCHPGRTHSISTKPTGPRSRPELPRGSSHGYLCRRMLIWLSMPLLGLSSRKSFELGVLFLQSKTTELSTTLKVSTGFFHINIMLGHIALSAAWLAAGALAGADVVVRNAPGKSTAQTLHAIRDRLIEARQEGQNEVFSNSTDIDSSFSNIVLLRT